MKLTGRSPRLRTRQCRKAVAPICTVTFVTRSLSNTGSLGPLRAGGPPERPPPPAEPPAPAAPFPSGRSVLTAKLLPSVSAEDKLVNYFTACFQLIYGNLFMYRYIPGVGIQT